jgi:hypothetical protein
MIKIRHCSNVLSVKHRDKFCSPSPAMVTSPYAWMGLSSLSYLPYHSIHCVLLFSVSSISLYKERRLFIKSPEQFNMRYIGHNIISTYTSTKFLKPATSIQQNNNWLTCVLDFQMSPTSAIFHHQQNNTFHIWDMRNPGIHYVLMR